MQAMPHTGVRAGRWLILAAVCLAALIPPLGFTGGAVATPAIGHELGGSPLALNWIVNAYMLAFGSSLMVAGTLADQYGRKRIFGFGVGLFVLASLGLGLVHSLLGLNLLRAVQGLGGALILAGGTAALAQEFHGAERPRAFAMLGTTFGIGLAFGPVSSGLLIEAFGWRSTFLAAAAVGGVVLLFGLPRMHESRDPDAIGLDWPGSVSFSVALAMFTFGIMQAPEHGWASARVLGLLGGAATWMLAFVWVEGCVRRPMLDLSLFRYARFIGVQVLPLATCYSYVVLLIMLPIRFIGIEGHSELDAGLMLMALSLPMLVVPALAAMLAQRISAGLLSSMGLLLAAAGLWWMSRIAPGQSIWAWAWPMLVVGVGTGLPWGLMDGLSISVVPPERAGMATGIFSTTRVAGECIALALVGAVLVLLLQARLQKQLPNLDADVLSVVAQRLATGNLAQAQAWLPGIDPVQLTSAYGEAFGQLVSLLATITVLSAVVVLLFLGRSTAPAVAVEADPSPCG